jgi:Na+/H+-dicarboxylate symporter/ABC-type amino acid transport substrate-binding protein
MSFSKRIVLGLLAGIACGLFFGELIAPLKVIADGFVKLLQMTVLPYVTMSIITSLGSLSYAGARRLGLRAGAVILALWGIALAFSFLIPFAFPSMETASFFSTTLVEHRPPFNFVDLYIPSNPFYSLAYNVVPAVVLFSVILGIALIGVPQKQRLIDVLSVAMEMLSRATRFVVKLTPFGIFAISAHAAGTLSLEQVGRIQIYLITYVAVALLLALWVLPGLVSALTPIPLRDIFSSNRDALLTAFIAGDLFIVLPALTEACEEILVRHRITGHEEHKLPEVIVPASFNFPHTGKLLSLSFVLFAGWFADAALALADYPQLAASGLLTFFGSLNSAIPFLLDLFRIPADTFQLFLATGVINSRFGTLLAAIHTIVVALLGSAAIAGAVRFQPARLLRYGIIAALLTVITFGGLRALFSTVLQPRFEGAEIVYGMKPVHPHEDSVVLTGDAAMLPPPAAPGGVLANILARGVLRVGYFPNRMPYAFMNRHGKLIGFDIERAHALARELGVKPQFIALQTSELAASMASGRCDIIMTGAVITPRRGIETLFSNAYMDETFAFAVRDYRRHEFIKMPEVRDTPGLRIAAPNVPHYLMLLQDRLPLATIIPIDLDLLKLDEKDDYDAYVIPAERGSIMTLLHPSFTIVVPEPANIKMPLAYPLAKRDMEWASVVNTWIELRVKEGTFDILYKHWILGQSSTGRKPRWSIMHNVLHWGG